MTAGNEYAQAIFMLAQENSAIEEYSRALLLVQAQFEENPLYLQFLASPNIPRGERQSAVADAFGAEVPEQVLSLLQLLIEQGRISGFNECVEEFELLKAAAEQTLTATVKSAVELSDEQREALREKLEKLSGKKVIIENLTDRSLIGGMIVEMDGKVLDGSIRHQLSEVKEVIGK